MTRILVQIVAWSEQKTILQAIRRQVFVTEQGVSEDEEWDGKDDNAIHFLASLGVTPVGCTRFLPEGKITRMAVLSNFRRKGVGAQLLKAIMARAQKMTLTHLTLDSQLQAMEFYAKYGFTPSGDIFIDAGIAHRRMEITVGGD